MSASAGTITGTFGWSNSPLAQGMREAEQMAKTSGGKIAAILNDVPRKVNWHRLADQRQQFLAPIRRGRTAADFLPAPAGKYASPDESEETGRRRNVLTSIVRGVGVLGLAHFATRILKDMGDAQAKADELAASITKITSGSFNGGSFRAIGEIDSEITSLKGKLEELKAADRPQSQSGALQQLFDSGFVAGGLKEVHRLSAEQQHKIESAITRDLTAQVEKQQQLTALANESFSGSERAAAIQKQLLAFKERQGAIDAKYGLGSKTNELQKEAAAQNLTALSAINQAADLKEAEVHSEIDLAMLRKTAVTTAQLHNRQIMERIRLNQAEAAGPSTQERREQLSAQRIGLEADRDAGLLGQARRPFKERQAEIDAAKNDKRDLDRLQANKGLLDVHRDMSGAVISGVDPFTNKRVDASTPRGQKDATVNDSAPVVQRLDQVVSRLDQILNTWR